MAYAALLRYKEESVFGKFARNPWPSGFTRADDAWLDNSEEGANSFFEKPKEKKKVVRKLRRGY